MTGKLSGILPVAYYPLHTAEYATVILASDWLYFSRHGLKGGTKRYFLSNLCEFGTVGKISDYQPEGFGFNHQSGRRLNFRRSFATLSVGRDVESLVYKVSQRSIGGL